MPFLCKINDALLINSNMSFYLLLTFFYLMILLSANDVVNSESILNSNAAHSNSHLIESAACQLVSRKYLEMNLPVEDVPRSPLTGSSLHVCKKGPTCCSEAMETKLSVKALNDGLNVFKETELRLNSFVDSRVKSFQNLIESLLDESYNEFNSMFSRTYGFQYQDNKALFTSLYAQLRAFHPGRINRLRPVLDKFFRLLFRKLFVLIQLNPKFKPEYLNCVENKMTQLAPFGDKASKLTDQVIRAFVTTRTYVQGLQVARSIISSVYKQVTLMPECAKSLLRLRYCNLCNDRTSTVLPCPNSCRQVVRGCFEQQALLHPHWSRFLDILSRTADVVAGPFNLKVILKPLGFKISDAIMAFQSSKETILQKVRQTCGQPLDSAQFDAHRRSKRVVVNNVIKKADNHGVIGASNDQNNFGWRYENVQDSTSNSGTIVHMIKEMTAAIKITYNMWKNTAEEQLCSARRVAPPNRQCWNGTSINTLDSVAVPLSVPKGEVGPVITRSIDLLKQITSNLEKAHKGEEVDYIKHFQLAEEPNVVNHKSSSLGLDNGSGEEGSGGFSILKATRRSNAARHSLTTTVFPDQEPDSNLETDGISGDGNTGLRKTPSPIVHHQTRKDDIVINRITQAITTSSSVAMLTTTTRKPKAVTNSNPTRLDSNEVHKPDGSSGAGPDQEGGPDDNDNDLSSSGDGELVKSHSIGEGSGAVVGATETILRTVQPIKGSLNGAEDQLGKDLWPEPKSDKGGAEIGLGSVEMAAKAQIGTNNVNCHSPTCSAAKSKVNGIFITLLMSLMAAILVLF